MPALILVFMLFPATVWAQETVFACVKNSNGQVRIVAEGDRCLPSEHLVQWTAGGPGTSSAQPGPLQVLDANDVAVGMFVPASNAAKLVGDLWVALPVTPNGFQITDPNTFTAFYQTTNCQGDPYLPITDATSLLRTGYVMPSQSGPLAFSYPGKPEVARTTIVARWARAADGTWNCYAFTPSPFLTTFGKIATVDVSTFQAPFKIVQ